MTPETLLRWHRHRVARHWTQPTPCRRGRPSTAKVIRNLIIEMATDNPTWGYRRITAELNRLGHLVGASTVWRILKQHDIEPAPNRSEVTWTQFLRSQAAVACDFATIDTAFLRRYYLLFVIDITSREVFYAGITANPTGAWTTQTARNLFLGHHDRLDGARALVRDRGSQFVDSFDEIFRTEGLKILRTPFGLRSRTRSPSAGSEPCDESSSTGRSSGTNDSSNDSSPITSATTTSTGPTAPSASNHHDQPTKERPRTNQAQPCAWSGPHATTASSTNTETQPDQRRRNIGHPHPRPHRLGPGTLDEPLEARAQRICHHLRRETLLGADPTTNNDMSQASYTAIRTVRAGTVAGSV